MDDLMRYPKIQTIYKRDQDGRLLLGNWTDGDIKKLAGNHWEFTEKVDGMNIRICWDGNDYVIKGRGENSQIPPKLVDKILFTIQKDKLSELFTNKRATLFFEGFGGNIQRGKRYGEEDIVLFDVAVDAEENENKALRFYWLDSTSVTEIADKLGCKRVPIVGIGSLFDLHDIVSEAPVKSELSSDPFHPQPSEGIVARLSLGALSRYGDRYIVKLKYRDFHNAVMYREN